MKHKITYSLLLLLFFSLSTFAQMSNVYQARSWVTSAKKDISKARSLIQPALTNKSSKDETETWYVAGLIEFSSFEINRDSKNKDMYKDILSTYEYWKRTTIMDIAPNEKGKIKPKYIKKISTMMSPNYVYLAYAGEEAYNNKNYEEAHKYFNAYVDVAEDGVMVDRPKKGDKVFQEVCFFRALSAMQMGNQKLAIAYFENLKDDTYKPQSVYACLCTEYEKIGDTIRWEETLREALQKFPDNLDYTKSLINFYILSNQKGKVMTYLNKALKMEPNSVPMWSMKGEIYEEYGDLKNAKTCYEEALRNSSEDYSCLVNMGRLYYNMAVKENNEINAIKGRKEFESAYKDVEKMYKNALPYFEKAYQVNPEGREALMGMSGIYYKLNMGKQYEKVEKELRALDKKRRPVVSFNPANNE
ncbi:MAG TPA: hypothetical protein DDY68_03895 [Porphyromonadaceae bacterium]|nr:hypothetical protein [Porphyromonadaceae bacterium]